MDFMDFSRRLYRWASEGVDMYAYPLSTLIRSGVDCNVCSSFTK